MISITGFNPYTVNNEADLHPDWRNVLRLEFDDLSIRGAHLHGITQEQAAKILAFLNAVQHSVDKVFVHCLAGVPRSAGVEKFVAERYALEFDHSYGSYNRLVYDTLKEGRSGCRRGVSRLNDGRQFRHTLG